MMKSDGLIGMGRVLYINKVGHMEWGDYHRAIGDIRSFVSYRPAAIHDRHRTTTF